MARMVAAIPRFIYWTWIRILPKGFQRVRYYGLQATKHLERSKAILQEAINKESKDEQDGKRYKSDDQIKMTFSDRVKRWWGKDPAKMLQVWEKDGAGESLVTKKRGDFRLIFMDVW